MHCVDMMKNSLEDSSDDTISDVEYAKEELAMFDEAVSAREDVYRYLHRYDISNSVANVIAASRMMRAPGKIFGTLFNEDEMSYDDIDAIGDIKEQILERFSEAIKTPQELADAQEQLAELAAHAMDNMIIEDKNLLEYVYYYLNYFKSFKIHRLLETGTQSNINAEMVKNINIPFFDQTKNLLITQFFNNFDLKIKKEKDILELYKKQKAYLLKNMFI